MNRNKTLFINAGEISDVAGRLKIWKLWKTFESSYWSRSKWHTHKKTKTKRIIFGNNAITMGESLHENLLKGKRFL